METTGGQQVLTTGQVALLDWCQKNIAKATPNVKIKNFGSSWSDGKAFVYLLYSLRPNLIEPEGMMKETANKRIETVFTTVQDKLKIDKAIEVEDIITGCSDDYGMGLTTYLLKWYILEDNKNSQIRARAASVYENKSNLNQDRARAASVYNKNIGNLDKKPLPAVPAPETQNRKPSIPENPTRKASIPEVLNQKLSGAENSGNLEKKPLPAVPTPETQNRRPSIPEEPTRKLSNTENPPRKVSISEETNRKLSIPELPAIPKPIPAPHATTTTTNNNPARKPSLNSQPKPVEPTPIKPSIRDEMISSCVLLDEHITAGLAAEYDENEETGSETSSTSGRTDGGSSSTQNAGDDEEINQVLADIVSEKPRLAKPTRNMGAKNRRPPTKGATRLGAKVKNVKTETEDSNKTNLPKEENLQYLLKEIQEEDPEENGGQAQAQAQAQAQGGAGAAGTPRRTMAPGGPNLAQAALGVKLKKAEPKPQDPKTGSPQLEEVPPAELPEWKQKLLAKKKDNAAKKQEDVPPYNTGTSSTYSNNSNNPVNSNKALPVAPIKMNPNPNTNQNHPPVSPRRTQTGNMISTRGGTVVVNPKKEEDYLEGFLYKQDHDRKDSAKWKRRWFVVKGSHLVYYSQQLTKKNSNKLKPLGILSLEMVESVTKTNEGDKQNVLKLTDRAKENYCMFAETEDEVDVWIESLSEIVKTFNDLRALPQEEQKRKLRYATLNATTTTSVPNLLNAVPKMDPNSKFHSSATTLGDRRSNYPQNNNKDALSNNNNKQQQPQQQQHQEEDDSNEVFVSSIADNLLGPQWSMISANSKEGTLLKLGQVLLVKSKWSEYHYSVVDGFITEMKNKGGKATCRVPLMGCELKEYTSSSRHPFAFTVISSKKQLVLAAKDLEEMHGWMNALVKQRLHIEEAMNAVAGAMEK